MPCPDCGRHSVICGGCGKCLQEHYVCVEHECLKCGIFVMLPRKAHGYHEHDYCGGGQLVRAVRKG